MAPSETTSQPLSERYLGIRKDHLALLSSCVATKGFENLCARACVDLFAVAIEIGNLPFGRCLTLSYDLRQKVRRRL